MRAVAIVFILTYLHCLGNTFSTHSSLQITFDGLSSPFHCNAVYSNFLYYRLKSSCSPSHTSHSTELNSTDQEKRSGMLSTCISKFIIPPWFGYSGSFFFVRLFNMSRYSEKSKIVISSRNRFGQGYTELFNSDSDCMSDSLGECVLLVSLLSSSSSELQLNFTNLSEYPKCNELSIATDISVSVATRSLSTPKGPTNMCPKGFLFCEKLRLCFPEEKFTISCFLGDHEIILDHSNVWANPTTKWTRIPFLVIIALIILSMVVLALAPCVTSFFRIQTNRSPPLDAHQGYDNFASSRTPQPTVFSIPLTEMSAPSDELPPPSYDDFMMSIENKESF